MIKNMKRTAFILQLLLLLGLNASGQTNQLAQREQSRLDSDWRFKRVEVESIEPGERLLLAGDYGVGAPSIKLDDSGWQTIDLPHDFVVDGNFAWNNVAMTDWPQDNPLLWSGSLAGGVGWYRKHFNLPDTDEGQRVYLIFDGVFRNSRVYLNQCFAGSHRSGYSSFFLDVTDQARFGGENLLAVRADATAPEGWFYEGGGIYRHVWLLKTPAVHVAPWGVFASSQVDFSSENPSSTVRVSATLVNKTLKAARCTLTTTLIAPDQQVADESSTEVAIPAWGQLDETHTIAVKAPQLWFAGAAQYVSSDYDIETRRFGWERLSHHPLWHPHHSLRCQEGVSPKRKAAETQRCLLPPGPCGSRDCAARRFAGIPHPQA